jgi:hypothetical protein
MSIENVEAICIRYQQLKGEREANWDTYVQECADFVLPRHNQIVEKNSPGNRRRLNIYDSTAIISNERLAAGMFSYMTPANKRWFEFTTKREDLLENEDVRRWFSRITELTYQEIAKSNFALEMHELYLTLGFAGTACFYQEEGENNTLNFENIHYSLFVFERGEEGIADTVMREFELTARKAIDKWGEAAVSEKIVDAAKDPTKQDEKFTFVHAVFPRKERDPEKLDAENKAIASLYFELETKHKISEGGYDEMPFSVPRFVKDPKEKYGRSPAMSVLETIKLVNAMVLTFFKTGQRVADPPMLVPSIDQDSNINTAPGKISYYKPNQWNAKPEPLNTGANVEVCRQMILGEREVIRQAFYSDLFAMLIENQEEDKTATEVRELVDERETIFAPTWGRLQSELFAIQLNRSAGILLRSGAFPEVPEELLINEDGEAISQEAFDIEFDIEYLGKLAIKIKSTEVLALFNTMELIAPLAEVDPTIMDWFNLDEVPKFTAERFGMPVQFVHKLETVLKIREDREKNRAAQQQFEQQMEMAKVAPGVSGPVDANSLISQISGVGVG